MLKSKAASLYPGSPANLSKLIPGAGSVTQRVKSLFVIPTSHVEVQAQVLVLLLGSIQLQASALEKVVAVELSTCVATTHEEDPGQVSGS